MKLTINGTPFETDISCTILEACKKQGIKIPTLCNDPKIEPLTSCFLCVVEVEGAKGFLPACSTQIREGMIIKTDSESIKKTRKLCLELLLSDHAGDCYAPCRNNCPAGIDIQSYIAQTANKDYLAAVKTIKERNPFPSVCGRVCPKPCEEACRRSLLEAPVAINNIKRFIADVDLNNKTPYIPQNADNNGKKVAIVGAGPAGLTCAYYLRQEGCNIDIFETTSRPGGMLMWGIPEYRLPKETLLKEIGLITTLGINIEYNKTLGHDFSLKELKSRYDAVFLAIGAQKSTAMRIRHEETSGVYGGVDFLHNIASGKKIDIGENVIVVGGGNTAIDAARTSIRLGAKKVSIVYRRTKEEMPAELYEIEEAIHEGIAFSFLLAPTEVIVKDGKLCGLKCQAMELGEPDMSGRRRPVPINGKEEILEADTIISAIGQYVDTTGLTDEMKNSTKLALTRWGTIVANEDKKTFETNIPGVFAGGDAVTGPSIAISAIAHGRYAAQSIKAYLTNSPVEKDFRNEFNFSLGETLAQVDKEYLPQADKKNREKNELLPVSKRLDNFNEVDLTFNEKQALSEASRCLKCGCMDLYECKLRQYAMDYEVSLSKISGARRKKKIDDSSKYLVFDSTKCIKCGKCINICNELKGIGALGFVNRGFDTEVLPALEKKLIDTTCVECGQCESICPTGAITDKSLVLENLAQFQTTVTPSICKECSIGCEILTITYNDKIIRIIPKHRETLDESMLCKVGRYEALENLAASKSFDFSNYEKLSLYDKAINNLNKAIENSKAIINYNVDIFNYYAPVSYHLKQAIDKKKIMEESVSFFSENASSLYAFEKYNINKYKNIKSSTGLKKLLEVIKKNKNILVFIEETSLNKEELKFFSDLKTKETVTLINLVRRTCL